MKRTIFYIDGFNLYYRRLKETKFKWLDLVKFADNFLKTRTDNSNLEFVHYFSAPIKGKYARRGQDSVISQENYFKALVSSSNGKLKITKGKINPHSRWLPSVIEGTKQIGEKVNIFLLEEKKTDVNIAINMYEDARSGKCDQIILITNDSDQEPTITKIKQNFSHIEVGIIFPLSPNEKTLGSISSDLKEAADWYKSYISDTELQNAQLPTSLQNTNGKTLSKPNYW